MYINYQNVQWTVASLAMGYWGTCPLEFGKFCAFCSFCQLNCKKLKITKEKHVLHFRLYRQKHAKIHVSGLKPIRNPGQRRRGKIHVVSPLALFPGDATGNGAVFGWKFDSGVIVLRCGYWHGCCGLLIGAHFPRGLATGVLSGATDRGLFPGVKLP